MSKATTTAMVLEDIPKGAWDALMKYMDDEEHDIELKEMEDLIEFIKEGWDTKQRNDSNYIYTDFSLKIEGWKFEVTGSEYKKDSCICDMQMDEEVYITDLALEKEEKAKEKKASEDQNVIQWTEFFKGKTKEEIFEAIKHTKFAIKEEGSKGKKATVGKI